MRYLIATAGSHGDVLPFIAIGKELARRSPHNEVFIYGTPLFSKYVYQNLTNNITKTDDKANNQQIHFIPVSSDEFYYQTLDMISQKNPIKSMSQIMRTMTTASPLLMDAIQMDVTEDSILIGSSLNPAHRIVAEKNQLPTVSFHLAPAIMYSEKKLGRALPMMDWYRKYLNYPFFNRLFWQGVELFISGPNFTQPLNEVRKKYHLPEVRTPVFQWINNTDLLIGLFPQWFANPQSDWDKRLHMLDFPLYDSEDSQPMSEEIQQFLQTTRQQCKQNPVVFSAGTATSQAHDFFVESVNACKLLNMPAIIVSHIPAQIPKNLPDNIIAVSYAPFSQLLSQASVFVYHGGVGSMSQALLASVPQLVRPVAFDQFDNAQRVVDLGVGIEVLPKNYTAKTVAKALQSLQSESYQQTCQIYAKKMSRTAIVDSCNMIEKLA